VGTFANTALACGALRTTKFNKTLDSPAGTSRTDPLIGPPQDNDGRTRTHALVAGSPAIDAGNNMAGLDTDQRGSGFARVVGSAADIGAFETNTDVVFVNGFN
jgi:hypothetical protein